MELEPESSGLAGVVIAGDWISHAVHTVSSRTNQLNMCGTICILCPWSGVRPLLLLFDERDFFGWPVQGQSGKLPLTMDANIRVATELLLTVECP